MSEEGRAGYHRILQNLRCVGPRPSWDVVDLAASSACIAVLLRPAGEASERTGAQAAANSGPAAATGAPARGEARPDAAEERQDLRRDAEALLDRVRIVAREFGLFAPTVGVAIAPAPPPPRPDERPEDLPPIWWEADEMRARDRYRQLLVPTPAMVGEISAWTEDDLADVLRKTVADGPPELSNWVEAILQVPQPDDGSGEATRPLQYFSDRILEGFDSLVRQTERP